jgi:hypothetical protein
LDGYGHVTDVYYYPDGSAICALVTGGADIQQAAGPASKLAPLVDFIGTVCTIGILTPGLGETGIPEGCAGAAGFIGGAMHATAIAGGCEPLNETTIIEDGTLPITTGSIPGKAGALASLGATGGQIL